MTKKTFFESFEKIKKPSLALFGALVFVILFRTGEEHIPAFILGNFIADITGNTWNFFASSLGVLGGFFSGSNTVSNITFGTIQYSISQNLNLETATILALQNAGGAMGNMVSIQNIIAACSVVGLQNIEGKVLKKTIVPLLIYFLIVGVMGFFI